MTRLKIPILAALLLFTAGCQAMLTPFFDPATNAAVTGIAAVVDTTKAQLDAAAERAKGKVELVAHAASEVVADLARKADAKIEAAGTDLIKQGEKQGGPLGAILASLGAVIVGAVGTSIQTGKAQKKAAITALANPTNGGLDAVKNTL